MLIRSGIPSRVMVRVTTIPPGDAALAHHDYGSGYPVIFINGLASAMNTWNPPVLKKISKHFRVIVFNNRGTGHSAISDGQFSVPLFAKDTAFLLDSLGISRAHVLGFSMGACIAQELALAFPKKVNRLILVAGDCGGADAVRGSPDIFSSLTDKSGTMEEVAQRVFPLLFPPTWLATHDPFRFCPGATEITSPENSTRQLAAFSSWRGSLSRLENIESSTLVITGDEDVVIPPENSRLLRCRIPHAKLVVFPGAGHGLMYQCPNKFSQIVLTFLKCNEW